MASGKHHSDVEGLLEKVAGLRPLIEQHIETSEHERRLATPIFEGLRDAGLFQLMVPKALGGFELDPVSALLRSRRVLAH